MRCLGIKPSEQATAAAWHEKTLEWQSPWEYRALDRQKRRASATDFTADQSPEVEQTGNVAQPTATR